MFQRLEIEVEAKEISANDRAVDVGAGLNRDDAKCIGCGGWRIVDCHSVLSPKIMALAGNGRMRGFTGSL